MRRWQVWLSLVDEGKAANGWLVLAEQWLGLLAVVWLGPLAGVCSW